jgi:hypothetical protein
MSRKRPNFSKAGLTMSKQFKLMIIVNAFLGLLYVISSYSIWAEINRWGHWNITSIWSPILITAYRIPNLPTVQMPVGPLWNFPFILFWVILGVNIYFIVRLQRGN